MAKDYLNTELTEEEISEIKKEISFNDTAKKKDTIILIVLLLVGVLGLLFVLFNGSNSTFAQNNNVPVSQEDENHHIKKSAKSFNIKGYFNTTSPIIVHIKDFNEESIYRVDFGDNEQKLYTSSIITHQYKKEGRFKLTILNTSTFEIESKVIFINNNHQNIIAKK